MRRAFISSSLVAALLFLLNGCSDTSGEKGLYHGRLEVETITLSAALAGELEAVYVTEGARVKAEQQLALIETTPMEYELVRLQAQLQELTLSSNGLQFQERKLQAQLELIETNINRTINMLADNAVPANRLDELQTEAIILQTQLEGLDNQRSVFASKAAQLSAARATLQWQLQQASVRAPRDGVVLELLRHAGERVAAGMSLMTIGNPLLLEATIYLPLPDLPQVRLGDSAEVQCDGFDSNLPGIVSWIAEETEFTPKTIQTRETRTALVCAVRITVANPDGVLKAGMPVDVRLRNLMNDTQE